MTENAKATIQSKLVTIQSKLAVKKTGNGRFGEFANLPDMLTALKPLLQENRLTLILDNEMIEIGSRTYVQATAYLSDGEGVATAKGQAWEGDISRGLDSSQITGSASTYARKYALAGLFAITDGSKDADGHEKPAEAPKTVRTITKNDPASMAQKGLIKQLLERQGVGKEDMQAFLEEEFGLIPGAPVLKIDAKKIIDELLSKGRQHGPAS